MAEKTVAEKIAAGERVSWEDEFDHPVHGTLKFHVDHLPKAKDWVEHELVQAQISPGNPTLLSAALAGLQTFIECPVIKEERVEDPDTPGHVKLKQVRYDPIEDEFFDFPMKVWLTFYDWRVGLLSNKTVEAVKNSSGATSGAASADSSPASTD